MREYTLHPYVHCSIVYAKIWKQLKCPSVNEWVKRLQYIYTMEYYLAIQKEGNVTFCDSMDGPREYYVKWNKPVKERQISCDFTYMWNLMNKTNKIETDSCIQRTDWQRSERRAVAGLGVKLKGLSENKNHDRHRQQYGDDQREKREGEAESVKGW